jgi:hypothetical protein
MYTRIEKQGGKNKEIDVFVAATLPGAHSNSWGAVSHPLGSDEIYIRSTLPSEGAISIIGERNIRLLRDALIEICKMKNIE